MLLARQSNAVLRRMILNYVVKSDRINALRKQYDAFLEEDKKRKERNEYILGKLDNMRYSVAVLPLRRKAGVIPDRNAALYQLERQQEKPKVRDYQLYTNPTRMVPDVPTNLDESFLMKEISKKYILIPKLSSALMNNYFPNVTPAVNIEPMVDMNGANAMKNFDGDNADWKSKYEILNILKKEEKEVNKPTQPDHDIPTSINKPVKVVSMNDNVTILNEPEMTVYSDSNISQKYMNELPEKDISNELNYEKSPEKDGRDDYAPTPNYNETYSALKDNQNEKDHLIASDIVSNDPMTEIEYKLQHTNLEHYNNEDVGNSNESALTTRYEPIQTEYEADVKALDNDQQNSETLNTTSNNIANVYQTEAEAVKCSENEYTEQSTDNVAVIDDISQVQVLNPKDFVEEINKVPLSVEGTAEDVEYPVEVINVQEFTPNVDVELKDGVNVNPEGHIMQPISFDTPNQDLPLLAADGEQQNPDDVTGIEEFDSEQQNMFYSEQTDPNYEYQEGVDAYNQEYAQNEHYQQGGYDYNPGTQPEVYQPVDINEHEETTLQYDPNYQQQYEGTYEPGYEEQVFQQNEQQYQETEPYPTQPEMDQMHYQQENQETPEQLHQELNDEQGYTEMENFVQAHEVEQAAAEQAIADENPATEISAAEVAEAP